MAKPIARTLNPIASVVDGYCLAQNGLAGTPLNLNGSLVVGGVGKPDIARRVAINSAGNDVGNTFTIVGTARTEQGNQTLTEVVSGANGVALSTQDFLTVTSVTPSANTASTVRVGTNASGNGAICSDAWIPWDQNQTDFMVSFAGVVNSGNPTWQVDYTYDDVFALLPAGKAPFPTPFVHGVLNGQVASKAGNSVPDVPRASRLTLTAIGSVTLTSTQAGAGR